MWSGLQEEISVGVAIFSKPFLIALKISRPTGRMGGVDGRGASRNRRTVVDVLASIVALH